MSAPRIVTVTERGKEFLPRKDLIGANGQSLIYREVRDINAIEIRDVADGTYVHTLGVVGYLPLTDSITLNIVPKFPIENFWRILEVGNETFSRIFPIMRGYQTAPTSTPVEMLARSFCHYLRRALSAGIFHDYYKRQNTGYFRPRVEFGLTISRFLSRGNPVDTVSSAFEFGPDTRINRTIKAACLQFIPLIPPNDDWAQDRQLLQYALETLQRVQLSDTTSLIFNVDNAVPPRLRENYAGLIRVHHLLETGGGIAFWLETDGQELPSFLFNLEDIFERFIRQTLFGKLRGHDISVIDGNEKPGRLFEDSKDYTTKPDIVLKGKNKELLGIGEVKYRPRLRAADRYQLISHVTAAKAPIGVLFCPANSGEAQELERIGRLSTGAVFYKYRVRLEKDIGVVQDKMIQDIEHLLHVS